MDPNITKALNDKLYDKRKSGALELEGLIRESLAATDFDRIQKIVHQLCHEYAYAVHQPHARNGGLIGLAAASIALGPVRDNGRVGGCNRTDTSQEVARYLEEIVPPVLACFSDQDARVRYYACESMYNIAKVAKGEILVYFNQVFDALCKVVRFLCPRLFRREGTRLTAKTQLAADSELSVKNGAELLDRLVKDIVAESAATYVSVIHNSLEPTSADDQSKPELDQQTAFSLERFLPLLEERVNVLNPFTRTFLVAWITLLDSIPDLELVAFLPRFLGGLFKFLSDQNQDVHTATQVALDRFLSEIRKIARIKQGIAESKKSQGDIDFKRSTSSLRSGADVDSEADSSVPPDHRESTDDKDDGSEDSGSIAVEDEKSASGDGDWVPGQDVHVDYPKILEILVTFLGAPFGDKGTSCAITIMPYADGSQRKRTTKSYSQHCGGLIASSTSALKLSCRLYLVY